MRGRDVFSRPHRLLGFLLAVSSITQLGCEDEGKGKLVIEDNALGSWIAINNTFAIPAAASRESGKNYYWTGVLLQIGDFPAGLDGEPPRYVFDKATFSKGGNAVGTSLTRVAYSPDTDPSTPDKAFWINIVSTRTANFVDPLKTTDVLWLYPPYPTGHPCLAVTGVPLECLRTPMLHSGMDRVIGLITYWQGPHGFELEAKQPGDWLGNTFEFRLKDEFKIEVYEIKSGTAGLEVSQLETHAPGTIDVITVAKRPGGPQDGDKEDPPWPGTP